MWIPIYKNRERERERVSEQEIESKPGLPVSEWSEFCLYVCVGFPKEGWCGFSIRGVMLKIRTSYQSKAQELTYP